MAGKGDLLLDNNLVNSLYEQIKGYENTVLEALYEEYKNAFKISASNYFRGAAADSFKAYLNDGAINIITGTMNLSLEVTEKIQWLLEAFLHFETNKDGKVSEGVLDYIGKTLKAKELIFSEVEGELNGALRQASKYISVKGLKLDKVYTSYEKTGKDLRRIREDLYAADDEALKSAEDLLKEIKRLKTLIEKTMGYCYTEDGRLNVDNIGKMKSQAWYSVSSHRTLQLMREEDPFEYKTGGKTIAEDQWARGLVSDVYIYGGYTKKSSSYEIGEEKGYAYAEGKYTGARANGHIQFTDYISLSGSAEGNYREGDVKIGFSDEYKGFGAEGSIGAGQLEVSQVLGSENLNLSIKGEAKVLSADGKVKLQFEDDGQYAIGIDASATGVEASLRGGVSILSYSYKDSTMAETDRLLGFGGTVDFGLAADFALYAESKTAIETDFININATTVKIKAQLLLGAELNITVPTLYFKWPW